jgi:hypothetical protein
MAGTTVLCTQYPARVTIILTLTLTLTLTQTLTLTLTLNLTSNPNPNPNPTPLKRAHSTQHPNPNLRSQPFISARRIIEVKKGRTLAQTVQVLAATIVNRTEPPISIALF